MSGIMQLILAGVKQITAAVDPYFNYVTALLHGDGVNGGQNNTFLDSSTNNFTITRNGNTTQGSFSPFSQTGWSNYFDGSGDYLTVGSNSAFNMSTYASLEAFVYFNAFNNETLFFGKESMWIAYGAASLGGTNGKLAFHIYNGSWNAVVASSFTPVVGTWYHIVGIKDNTTLRIYINGVEQNTVSYAGTVTNTLNTWHIGGYIFGSYVGLNGYISNARYITGASASVLPYTGTSFTVPTTPLSVLTGTVLLTCQSNRFIDNSTNAFAITVNGNTSVQPFSPFNPTTPYSTSSIGGSGYFDGSGDYLRIADDAAFTLGSGDFTIECWLYPTAVGTTYRSFSGQSDSAGSASTRSFRTAINTTGKFEGVLSRSTSPVNFIATSTNSAVANAWQHYAFVRDGNTARIYINGVQDGTVDVTGLTVNNSSNELGIGVQGEGTTNTLAGYMSDYRMVVGTCLYPNGTSFTPSTTPLTAISGTALLLNYTNGAIFDNAAVADYETVGNAQISTSVTKYGTGSLAFDGTGDYLSAADSQAFNFGSGDWTIEAWLYINTAKNYNGWFGKRQTSQFGLTLQIDSSNVLSISASTTGSSWALAGASLGGGYAPGAWMHVAVTRLGNTITGWLNGTKTGTQTLSGSIFPATGYFATVGSGNDISQDLNGYIDDFRITKGIARYLYNFTPPTAEFPNIGGTVTLTADPYFEYTTLLLPGNGTNGAQNNTFLDSSTNNFTITRNGNTTQGTFSPFSQTGWGAYFNGSSDYISVADSADFTMGSGDFTVQCWVYSTANSGSDQYIFGQVDSGGSAGATSFQLYKKATSNVAEAFVYAGGSKVATGTAQIPVGQWTHLAMVRDGGTLRLYVNGSQNGTNATLSTTAITDSTGSFSVGRTGDYNGLYFAGYVSNVSVVKGTCLFPSGTTFTPSTTPLSTSTSGQSVLLCQANRFIDTNTATTAKTVTVGSTSSIQAFSPFNPTAAWDAATYGGSGYFDGSGDYLTTSSPTLMDVTSASQSFTVEAWIYPAGINASGPPNFRFTSILSKGVVYLSFGYTSTGVLRWYTFNGSENYINSSAGVIKDNAWQHVAVVSNAGAITLYVNGTSVATGSLVVPNGGTGVSPKIGAADITQSADFLKGYVSNLRVSNNAVYTSAFTPPTAPLTAIANTQLLLSCTNAGIYDATSKNDLETVGNAQISTTQSKFGGSSMYFDGSGDRLTIPFTNDFLELGINGQNFTVEAWIYPTNTMASSGQMLSKGGGAASWSTSNGAQYQWGINNSAAFWSWNSSGSALQITNGNVTLNTWQHLAVTYDGTTTRTFLNGVLQATSTSPYTAPTTRNLQYIGMTQSGGFTQEYYGYIQDLRITKGIARYFSNFTPPTTAFLTL